MTLFCSHCYEVLVLMCLAMFQRFLTSGGNFEHNPELFFKTVIHCDCDSTSRTTDISTDVITYQCVLVFRLSGWNELLIASFSHRSIALKDGVLLASELQRDSAQSAGVGAIFDRCIYGDKTNCQRTQIYIATTCNSVV